MKCKIIIDDKRDEEIIIYTHKMTALINEIESLCKNETVELIGFKDKNIIKLSLKDVFCFVVEKNKVFAILNDDKLQIKQRLYEIESILDDSFVKVNQSCIVNVKKIKRFDASFAGALMVTLENGYKDYVSRRQVRIVKQRVGI